MAHGGEAALIGIVAWFLWREESLKSNVREKEQNDNLSQNTRISFAGFTLEFS